MNRIALLIPIALLAGCYTQTDIKRTITRADGSQEIYENKSHGYNYNPNFTGHMDNNYQFHSSTHANSNSFVTLPPPQQAQQQPAQYTYPQYTIR
jgi:hypothetical protein